MNPHPLFCPNPDCPSRGVHNAGNIRLHDGRRQRWRCRTCKKTFRKRQGAPFFGLKTDPVTVVLILTLLTQGCPLQAIVAAYGFDERTVAGWQGKAGKHCEQGHAALVTATPMDLQHVQADEVRVRLQRRLVVWMAICVPTRLWRGGGGSVHRDTALLRSLARLVQTCAQCRWSRTAGAGTQTPGTRHSALRSSPASRGVLACSPGQTLPSRSGDGVYLYRLYSFSPTFLVGRHTN